MGSPGSLTDTSTPTTSELETATYVAFADMDSSPTKAWLVEHRLDKKWQWYYNIGNAFEGLTTRLTISLAIISAIISAFIRYVVRYSVDPQTSFVAVFSIGLIGDLLGSLIVIYFIKGGLYFYRQFSKN